VEEATLPELNLERALMLQSVMMAAATDGSTADPAFAYLRRELMNQPAVAGLLPAILKTHRELIGFRRYMQSLSNHYAERRQAISIAFQPLLDHLENLDAGPGDQPTSDALASFDVEGVHTVWTKALSRRANDPEGAITLARTLLETVCKRILDETGQPYDNKDDLPKLYSAAAKVLTLAPNQHTEEPIKAILGGAMNVVNGIGTLRNRLSDAHGRGGNQPVRASRRHATLTVNIAGALATFLVETFADRHPK